VPRWTVRCCRKCNHDYGILEEEVRKRLALCLDPDHPSAQGIVEKVLHSINPESGKGSGDERARAADRKRLLEGVRRIEPDDSEYILPNFGERSESPRDALIVQIPKHFLDDVARKIVRGVTFKKRGELITSDYSITIEYVPLLQNLEFIAMVTNVKSVHSWGPGLEITYVPQSEDPVAGMMRILLWQTWDISAVVLPLTPPS
jgi:hypothetical protein